MLFPEEDAPLLKAWIVKRIENTSDADSDVLAEYVIALLKHDGDYGAVRRLCEQEIPDFLSEGTPKAFLDDVFAAIRSKSYRPGAVSSPPSPSGERPAAPSAAAGDAAGAHVGARKRAFGDRGDAVDVVERDHADHRSSKLPRRGGRRGGLEDGRGGRHGGGFRPLAMPPLPAGMPQFDAQNPMEAMMQMQAMGMPFAGLQGYPPLAFGGRPQRHQAKHKARCRDFDTKGYCSRGSTCTFDHGSESIYVPPVGGEEYDPNDAVMHMPMALGPAPYNLDSIRGRGGRKAARGSVHRGARKGGARAPFSADGPVTDRSKSTIVVENIPEESFSEDLVRAFFSQFGTIVEVSMQPYKHLAVVKFDKWAAANDAYRSPKVIFDNRFVKVFWYKEETASLPAQAVGANDVGGSKLPRDMSPTARELEPEMDMEEFHRKQLEAQRQHKEKQSMREELERQRQELEKQQQDLLAKHQAESEQLRARLAEKNGGDSTSGSSATEMLRAKLAALEHEAKILGLDPHAAAADDGGAFGYRGGFRGRRGYRARGGYVPGGRGSFRGQGARHAAYAQYSIDNRPKRLAIHGVDFTPADRNEALRHFLLNLGEFESVTTTPSVTHVSFQDRKTAERFYHSLHGKELAGVDGRLDLSWVGAAAAGPGTAGKSAEGSTPGLDDEGGAAAGGDDDVEMQRPMDMDYEVGDDDGWDEGIQ